MLVTLSASMNPGCSSQRYNFKSYFVALLFVYVMCLTVHASFVQVIPHGLACQCGLRVGDRILEVNSIDLRHATHQEAVRALLANKQEIRMLVRRDPSPPGMQEILIQKQPGEKLGISIRGGAKGHAGNPFDPTDEGIFISKVHGQSKKDLASG